MKRGALFILILGFLFFSFSGIGYGWQGRMGGMGEPYGLVQDESDFLIHPAGITNGKGMNFYGNYRLNYLGVTNWNYSLDVFNPFTGTLYYHMSPKSSGHEWTNDGLLGAAFPLGSGRMGIFFNYVGKRGKYHGDDLTSDDEFHDFKMKSNFDNFALRLLYSLPVGGFKFGGEVQFAYRHEKNKTSSFFDGVIIENNPIGQYFETAGANLFPFMFPYDSKYWEVLLKGSLVGTIGPAKIAFTLWGGLPFGGNNRLNFMEAGIAPFAGHDLDGKVKGWNLGADFWLRYTLSKDLSLPFLVKIGYQDKKRNGDGPGFGTIAFASFDYKNRETIFQVEAGGGVDKELSKGTRVAAGIYYDYINKKNKFSWMMVDGVDTAFLNHSSYPDQKEHRITLKVLGEKEISPMVALRMGLNFLYGWGKGSYKFDANGTVPDNYMDDIPYDGSGWGIGASLGATVKFQRFSLEPFLGGGYQMLKLKGDGISNHNFPPLIILELSALWKAWNIGGGFSIKF